MIIFYTQDEFLKEFPITNGIINCRNKSFELKFSLNVDANICNAGDIIARNINAWNIKAWNIKAQNIDACHINARDIKARDIKAWNIKAQNINAWNIKAWDIKARDIKAWGIIYYAVCFAYTNIICKSIAGTRKNAKHFCIDGQITIEA